VEGVIIMSALMKWKKVIYLVFAAGIIGFAVYGIYHTAYAFNDLKQSTNTGGVLISNPPSDDGSLIPGGPLCNPAGCAGCTGCVKVVYGQNIEVLTGSTIQIEQAF
jgi:hypothetical protein